MIEPPGNPWRWVPARIVFAVHDSQIAEHGGADGLQDHGALESALARPANLDACGRPDIADLAAAYMWGLTRSHAFTDGNKRTAWVTGRLFLADNGAHLEFDPYDAIRLIRSSSLDQTQLVDMTAIRQISVAGYWVHYGRTPRSSNTLA